LPEVSRVFMLLEGQVLLNHKKKYKQRVNKFEFDTFDGGWKTTCSGTGKVFNLMTKGKVKGNVVFFPLVKKSVLSFKTCRSLIASYLYVVKGSIVLKTKTNTFIVKKNNLLVVPVCKKLNIEALEKAEVVLVEIS